MSSVPNAAHGQWRARAGLVYYYSTADRIYEGTEAVPYDGPGEVPNFLQLQIKMRLTTLVAGLDSPWGTGFTAILPWVDLWHSQNFIDPATDTGWGDAELRLRQDLTQVIGTTGGPRLGATLGAVVNNGRYLAAPGESTTFVVGQIDPNATGSREISIGRGVWWVLGDVDASWQVHPRWLVYGNAQYRQPVGEAIDGFSWGSEVRGSLGARFTILPKYLSLGASVDAQRRGRATYLPPGGGGSRQDYPNGGGQSLYLTPSINTNPWEWFNLTVALRQPLYDEVVGQQLVQNTAFFVSLTSSLSFGGTPAVSPPPKAETLIGRPAQVPEIAALVVAGKVTVVDYWATWCEPCMRLGPKLEAFAKARGDTAVQRVDATAWEREQWDHYLPGVAGLPVLDVFGVEGTLVMRLIGPDAEDFEARMTAGLPAGSAPAAVAPPAASTPVDPADAPR